MPQMSSPSPHIARQLRIHGRVQGVYYRASMVEEAQRQGAAGWVRNRADGSVEALAQGGAPAVQALVDWARRGPPQALVERVDVADAEPQTLPPFEQRATA